jgi:methylthioribose-1-phosphate isomerase
MRTIEWDSSRKFVMIIDQRSLPGRFERIPIRSAPKMIHAIKTMTIRGAPALGVATAFGMALAAFRCKTRDERSLAQAVIDIGIELMNVRPTAVNMRWAYQRIKSVCYIGFGSADKLRLAILTEAQNIADEDVQTNLAMAKYGSALIVDGDTIIHHCNTGALAAVEWGTALGCIRMAHEQGKRVHVLVDETRPLLQGSRLTAWELMQYRIPFEIICDGAAGYFLSNGKVQRVMFGADRVAANGDVANKIGTYPLALAAWTNKVPVISVCPSSSIDLTILDGKQIPIEQRDPDEVLRLSVDHQGIAPRDAKALNPAFDVTPNRYVDSIVTEKGVVKQPYGRNLLRILATEG